MGGPLGRAWYEALAGPSLSGLAERVADAELPQPVLRAMIKGFCAAFDVNMQEAAVPDGGFRTFNAFFTRALKPGSRPIDPGLETLVSPADSRVAAAGIIEAGGVLEAIKGRDFHLSALLGGDSLADALVGGFYATLYLSPRDYHRVHVPCDGTVVDVHTIPGKRYPVMPAALEAVDGLLAKNARTLIHIDSPTFGRVVAVMVGATNVSRISVVVRPGQSVARGDELGAFNLGSTVVLLAQRSGLRLSESAPLGQMTAVGRPLLQA